MLCFRPLFFSLVITSLLVSSLPFSCTLGEKPLFSTNETLQRSGRSNDVVLTWGRTERLLSDNTTEEELDSTMVLAPRKTYRKDPLDGFKMYTGGWNITNRHYWASVSYTAVPFFVIATIWFLAFGLCLSLICLCYCCCPREPYGYSRMAYTLSLIFLVLFSIAAIIGCGVLYTGQSKFHGITINTLDYVIHQADDTSDNLRNVSEYLATAKQFDVIEVSLPPNVQTDIDQIQSLLDSSASTLTSKTEENSKDIKNLIESVRVALIVLSAAMLALTFIGFMFSMFGMEIPVYILVVAGWILVTGTFILCGIFLLLHNVTGDTCVAMNQWIQNPTAHTALDDILPCVDHSTADEALSKSKEVASQLVDVINTVITNVSNINFAPNFVQLYFNQSGPLLPTLCNPFHPDLTDRACSPGEVDLTNATQVWSSFVCQASPSGICFTTGRLNPTLYSQMSSVVKVSYGLYQCSPFLVELADCSYARQAFSEIETTYCPGLRKYSERVYVGVVMVATAVMLSLVFWVIYGRERRHRVYSKGKEVRGGDEGFVYAKENRARDGNEGGDR